MQFLITFPARDYLREFRSFATRTLKQKQWGYQNDVTQFQLLRSVAITFDNIIQYRTRAEMKFIALSIRKRTYKVSREDIQKIYMQKERARPVLPPFECDIAKLDSPTMTEAEEITFTEDRDLAFLN